MVQWTCALLFANQALFSQQPSTEEEIVQKPRPTLPKGSELRVFKANPLIQTSEPLWKADETPAQFLESVGNRLKARWRQLYREPPPQPSTDRQRAAFTLGGLLADCYLTLQATDAQQFKNNSQDVLAYCRVLALGDKVQPRIMSASKLAEAEKWVELRKDVCDGHQELCRLMREQKDDDLALLLELGIWLRILEIVSTLVLQSEDSQFWPLTAGSEELVKSLHKHYLQISEPTRTAEKMLKLGSVIDYLQRRWGQIEQPVTGEEVRKTHERISLLMRSMTLK
jgi:hypothetical protein